MQRNNFDPAGTTQASLNLDRYRPTVVVWPNSRPSSGSTIPDKPPKPYPLLDGKAVVARWMGDHATFHFATTDDPESLLEDGPPSRKTDFHPSKSEVRFYPQGIDSLGYIPIKGSTCVYTNADGSHLLRPKVERRAHILGIHNFSCARPRHSLQLTPRRPRECHHNITPVFDVGFLAMPSVNPSIPATPSATPPSKIQATADPYLAAPPMRIKESNTTALVTNPTTMEPATPSRGGASMRD